MHQKESADTDQPVQGQEGVAGNGNIYTGQPTMTERKVASIQYVRQELSSDMFILKKSGLISEQAGQKALYSW
jgi:hypothetical protein